MVVIGLFSSCSSIQARDSGIIIPFRDQSTALFANLGIDENKKDSLSFDIYVD